MVLALRTGIQGGHFALSIRKRSDWCKGEQGMLCIAFLVIWDPLGMVLAKLWPLDRFPMKYNGKQLIYEGSDLVRPTCDFAEGCDRYESMRSEAVVPKIPYLLAREGTAPSPTFG